MYSNENKIILTKKNLHNFAVYIKNLVFFKNGIILIEESRISFSSKNSLIYQHFFPGKNHKIILLGIHLYFKDEILEAGSFLLNKYSHHLLCMPHIFKE